MNALTLILVGSAWLVGAVGLFVWLDTSYVKEPRSAEIYARMITLAVLWPAALIIGFAATRSPRLRRWILDES